MKRSRERGCEDTSNPKLLISSRVLSVCASEIAKAEYSHDRSYSNYAELVMFTLHPMKPRFLKVMSIKISVPVM